MVLPRNYYEGLDDGVSDAVTSALEEGTSPTASLDAPTPVSRAKYRKPAARRPCYSGYAWEEPLSEAEEAEFFDQVCPDFVPPAPASKSQRRSLRRRRVAVRRPLNAAAKPFLPSVADRLGIPTVDESPSAALGRMASENARLLSEIGWRNLATMRRGRSAMNPDVGQLDHEAAPYLEYLEKIGAQALSSEAPLSPEELQAAVDRGPHPSAVAKAEFLQKESLEMCARRHTMVLPFSAVKHINGVRISPPGVVPQRARRDRTICDLTYSGVNAGTVNLAPTEAMQFGNALRRILFQIYRADPAWGPVYLAKADISDGFYNISVNANGTKQFGIILPTAPGQEPLVLFFLGLPMGWVSSAPEFCAATESITDVCIKEIQSGWRPPPHRQEEPAETPTPGTRPPSSLGRPPRIRYRRKGPLGSADCYVDDFILLCQGGKRRRKRLRRILFHCIDKVFRPPDDADDEWKKDPISLKKLLQGDGSLETTKVVLGWLVDTVSGTIELPPHRVERLHEMLRAFPRSRRTCRKKDLHKLVGELRSMIIAIPGGVGCLSWLQERLKSAPDRIYLNNQFKDAIDDFKWLARDITSRPTRIGEVVPEVPVYVGCSDASGIGAGGVWLPDALSLYTASLNSTFVPGQGDSRGAEVGRAMEILATRPTHTPAASTNVQHRDNTREGHGGTRNPGRAWPCRTPPLVSTDAPSMPTASPAGGPRGPFEVASESRDDGEAVHSRPPDASATGGEVDHPPHSICVGDILQAVSPEGGVGGTPSADRPEPHPNHRSCRYLNKTLQVSTKVALEDVSCASPGHVDGSWRPGETSAAGGASGPAPGPPRAAARPASDHLLPAKGASSVSSGGCTTCGRRGVALSGVECRTVSSADGRGPAVASHDPRHPASPHPASERYTFPEAGLTPHTKSLATAGDYPVGDPLHSVDHPPQSTYVGGVLQAASPEGLVGGSPSADRPGPHPNRKLCQQSKYLDKNLQVSPKAALVDVSCASPAFRRPSDASAAEGAGRPAPGPPRAAARQASVRPLPAMGTSSVSSGRKIINPVDNPLPSRVDQASPRETAERPPQSTCVGGALREEHLEGVGGILRADSLEAHPTQRSCRGAGVAAIATSRGGAPANGRGRAVASSRGTGVGIPGSATGESGGECRTGSSAAGRGPTVASQAPRRPVSLRPILWRYKFPEDISSQLVSWENPKGKITNSDLELAGILGHNMVLAQLTDLSELTTATGTDNLPALSWSTKRAVSSTGPASYLLRLQSMHQRLHRYQLRSFYIPGLANKMADDCSRLWHLSDSDLLAYFDVTYPQSEPWQICHLEPESASALLSALSCSRQPLPEMSSAPAPESANMNASTISVPPSTSAQQTSLPTTTTSLSSPPTPSSTDVANWLLEVPPSSHALRKTLFDSLAKRSKCWASETRGLTQTPAAWTRGGLASGKTGNTMTTRRSGSSQSHSGSCWRRSASQTKAAQSRSKQQRA